MVQQRGMKRAAKVLKRQRRKSRLERQSNLRRASAGPAQCDHHHDHEHEPKGKTRKGR